MPSLRTLCFLLDFAVPLFIGDILSEPQEVSPVERVKRPEFDYAASRKLAAAVEQKMLTLIDEWTKLPSQLTGNERQVSAYIQRLQQVRSPFPYSFVPLTECNRRAATMVARTRLCTQNCTSTVLVLSLPCPRPVSQTLPKKTPTKVRQLATYPFCGVAIHVLVLSSDEARLYDGGPNLEASHVVRALLPREECLVCSHHHCLGEVYHQHP